MVRGWVVVRERERERDWGWKDEWLWEKKSKNILLEKRESLLINAQKINRAYDHTEPYGTINRTVP